MLSKIWVWDPGFGKNLFRINDPEHCSNPIGSATYLTMQSLVSLLLLHVLLWRVGVLRILLDGEAEDGVDGLQLEEGGE